MTNSVILTAIVYKQIRLLALTQRLPLVGFLQNRGPYLVTDDITIEPPERVRLTV